MGYKCATPTVAVDIAIDRVARLQHGVVSLPQLAAAGLSRDAVSKRSRRGRLHRLHHGVYAVGHRALCDEARWMAAVLACGEGAVLSHRSAAALWGLLPRSGPVVGREGGRIDVSIPAATGRRRRPGIRLHRCPSLASNATDANANDTFGPRLTSRERGIPVTTPARTIHDLRGTATAAEVRRALRRAEVLGLATELAPRAEPTRSDLEDLFLEFCARHGFPHPRVNGWIAEHEVDFSWPDLKVAVETDSYRFHRGAQAFENDRERDLDLRAAGYDVVRLTWRQLTHKPDRCTRAVEDALRSARRRSVTERR